MMAKTRKTEIPAEKSALPLSGSEESVVAMIAWPFDAWLACQANILEAAAPAASLWIERRGDGAAATLDAFERLAACGGLEEAAAIHREWLAGSVRRLDEDWRALADHAVCLSQEVVAITRRASPSGFGGTLPLASTASSAVAAIEEEAA
jgi:hypothetical protein